MASRIKVLPTDLVNRIAAGEIVERPASVLKELLENSLDSGAGRIDIEAEGGGKGLIRVSDDGCGMNPEEMRLCLERHATSKINEDSDLTSIMTLGFRGEALPSIASVSKLTITSSTGEGEGGFRLSVEGGVIGQPEPCPANKGTVMEVRDLFFNVPARRKFLKTTQTEEAHMVEAAERYALSRPKLTIRLVSDGRELVYADAQNDFHARLAMILGKNIAPGIRELSRFADGVRVRAWLSGPDTSLRTAASLYVYVLDRPVRDRLLTRAIIQGYGRTLPAGRYPAGLVFVDLDPKEVDVNVHPAKTEVRFRKGFQVFKVVEDAVAEAIGSAKSQLLGDDPGPLFAHDSKLPDRKPPGTAPPAGGASEPPSPIGEPPVGASPIGASLKGAASWGERSSFRGSWGRALGGGAKGHEEWDLGTPWDGTYGMGVDPPGTGHPGKAFGPAPSADDSPLPDDDGPGDGQAGDLLGQAPGLRPLAQLGSTYILSEGPTGLVITDQHAAHESILFNRLKNALNAEGLPARTLLIPDTLELKGYEGVAMARLAKPLRHIGYILEPFGESTYLLKGIPLILGQEEAKEALKEILDGAKASLKDLDGGGIDGSLGEVSESWLHSVACRAAIKAGHSLDREEMERLLEDVLENEQGAHCPHGRPSSITISYQELERKFGRS